MKLCVVLYVVILVIFAAMLWSKKREHFTLAVRDGLLCDPRANQSEDYLMPASVIFTIQGYNYDENPIIKRDGQKVIPLQLSSNHNNMVYYYTVAAPKGLCGHHWELETTDFVKPVVHDGRTGEPIDVDLLRRRYRYNHWELRGRC